MTDQNQTNEANQEDNEMARVTEVFDKARNAIIDASRLAKEVAALRETVETVKTDLQGLRERNAFLDDMLASVRRQRDEAETELAATKAQRDEARNDRDHWHRASDEWERRAGDFERKYEDERTLFNTQHSELNTTIAELQQSRSRVAYLEDALQSAQKRGDEWSARAENAEFDLETTRAELKGLRQKLQAIQAIFAPKPPASEPPTNSAPEVAQPEPEQKPPLLSVWNEA